MPDASQTAVHWSDTVIAYAATYGHLSLAGGIVILIVGDKVAEWSRHIVNGVVSRTPRVAPTTRRFLAESLAPRHPRLHRAGGAEPFQHPDRQHHRCAL